MTQPVRLIILTLCLLAFSTVAANTIHINQVGYQSDGPKIAVLETSEDVTTFDLIDAQSNLVVYSGDVQQGETIDHWYADKIFYQLSFTEFSTPGEYYLELSSLDISSEHFIISSSPLFTETLPLVLDYFTKSRADTFDVDGGVNTEVWDYEKELLFFDSESKTADVRGGWYDASADMSKNISHLNFGNYTMPQHIPLSAYIMADTYDRIPEQLQSLGVKNEMQQEAIWGADYLVRILDPDGYFYINIFDNWTGDLEQRNICAYKKSGAEEGFRTTNWQAGFREGGGLAIAALARISSWGVGGDFTSNDYLTAAERAWDHLAQNDFLKAKEYADDGVLNFIDDYSILFAAIELYVITESSHYKEAAKERVLAIKNSLHSDGYFIADGDNRPFYHAADAGLPVIALSRFIDVFSGEAESDAAREAIKTHLDYLLSVTNEVDNPFGYARQHIWVGGTVSDGHRTGATLQSGFFIDHTNETEYWWQGENARLASLASAALIGGRHLAHSETTAQGISPELHEYAMNQLSWILGKNPYDICFMNGKGRNNPPPYFVEKEPFQTSLDGGIANGITGAHDDGTGITWNTSDTEWGNWRWIEQWIPHAHWFMMAVAATVDINDSDSSPVSSDQDSPSSSESESSHSSEEKGISSSLNAKTESSESSDERNSSSNDISSSSGVEDVESSEDVAPLHTQLGLSNDYTITQRNSKLILTFSRSLSKNLQYKLFDLFGREVQSGMLAAAESSIIKTNGIYAGVLLLKIDNYDSKIIRMAHVPK